MKVPKSLVEWISRKRERCGKAVTLWKCYKANQCSRNSAKLRAIVHVEGEPFTRRLIYVISFMPTCKYAWKEVEHGVIKEN